jgi:hypothetical protein
LAIKTYPIPPTDPSIIEIATACEEARRHWKFSGSTPAEIVEVIDRVVDEMQSSARKVGAFRVNMEEVRMLGSLWGEQLIAQFGWGWVQADIELVIERKRKITKTLAVVHPDRTMLIYPFQSLSEFLHNPESDCTIALAFDMLLHGKHPKFKPGELVDFISGVQRIVPRR